MKHSAILLAIQPDIDNLQARQDELSDQIVRSAAGWTLLTITGPGLPWFLYQLWAGGTQRVRLIGLLKDFWGTRKEKNEAQRDLNRAIEELESDFESKSKALKKAVKKNRDQGASSYPYGCQHNLRGGRCCFLL